MTASTLTTLVRDIAGNHVLAFFLVLARVTPLFIVAPVFSSPQLIGRVRTILAVGLAIGLTPLAAHGVNLPSDPLSVAGLLIEGIIVGFAFAYAIACVLAAIQGAGVLADFLTGFSYGSTIDPVNGNPGGALTNLYVMVGTMLFLVIGGDAWTIRGLALTFRAVPLSGGPNATSLVAGAESMFSAVLVGAIEVAAPVMLVLVITDIAFGMVSKVVPQLNVFAVGFPVKVGVGLLTVGVAIPFIGGWMSGQLENSVTSALHSLSVA
jgi:flagellar biosynthetic protein FliR